MALGLLASLALGACGGGGGGGDKLSLSLSPDRITRTIQQGTSTSFTVLATVRGTVSGDVAVVISDPGGSINPGVAISQTGEETYSATFQTRSTLPAGTHTNQIQVRLCSDSACSRQYGSASFSYTFVVAPGPTINSFTPSQAYRGDPAFELTVSGSNFEAGSVVSFDNVAKPTRFDSASQLTVSVSESDLQSIREYNVQARNPSNGFQSGVSRFSVTYRPSPQINTIAPTSVAAGSPGFVMTVTGTELRPSNQVFFADESVTTTYVSPTELRADIPANRLRFPGHKSVVVHDSDTGQQSGAAYLNVLAPTVSALSPTSAVAGGPAFTMTLTGSDFSPSSVVLWDGSPRTTTLNSSSQISASITASDIAAAGTRSIQVRYNEFGNASNAPDFVVNNPAPGLTSISPQTREIGGADFTLTVNGNGFVSSSIVRWNGSNRPTTFVSATQLTATIQQADIATAGLTPVTVFSPTPGGGTTASATFTATNPVPILNSINAKSAVVGCQDFLLMVIADKIGDYSTVLWNGQARTTRLISDHVLQAEISAADIASAGTAKVRISNAGPGGGTSSQADFTIHASAQVPTSDAVGFRLNAAHNNVATTTCPISLPATSAWTNANDNNGYAPLVANGKVYITSQNGLSAFDLATGARVLGPVATQGYPSAYADGVLYQTGGPNCCEPGQDSGVMTAVDGQTGQIIYSVDLPGQRSFDAVTVLNGMAYVLGTGTGGTLYAVDTQSRTLRWSFSGYQNGPDGTPTVSSSAVYTTECGTTAFAPTTGLLLWTHPEPDHCTSFNGTSFLFGNRLYVNEDRSTGFSGHVLNASTGAELGSFQSGYVVESATARFAAAAIPNTIYSEFRATRISDGATLWSFRGDSSYINGAPILVNDVVFVNEGLGASYLYALDVTTGQVLWKQPAATGAAVVGGGSLLLVDSNVLRAFKISNP